MKKIISLVFAVFLCLSLTFTLGGCNKKETAQVYFLNFKPESAKVYGEIAKAYEKEKGVKVKVVTASSGAYEQTLKSEIAKDFGPTIFQINGPVGYTAWKDYCLDLKNTTLYNILTDKALAERDGDGVFAVPYVVEGYGIIYNGEIMEKYFSLPTKKTNISSTSEINSFEKLKAVAEDMTAHKKELGIEGAFAATSLISGEDWRSHTHLANIPIHYEFKDSENAPLTVLQTAEIAFKHADNYKKLFDLFLNNSTTEKGLLGTKSVADSMAEFALGKAAMVQNGSWSYSQIAEVKGNTVKADKIGFLPLYMDFEGEENQGICIGTENYLAINKKATPEQQKASLDFLTWLFTEENGKRFVSEELGFLTPFTTFSAEAAPADPLSKEVVRFMNDKTKDNVPWTFTSFPGEIFKKAFGGALLEYAQGSKTFDDVIKTVKEKWKEAR